MRQGLMSCSTDPAHVYADLELAPTFDRVLAVNKAALNGWSKLMKSTTEKTPPSGDEESDGSTSINGSNTVGSTPQEAPTSDRFSVRPTTIQAGALDLDAEDQADLRRTLLLRELNRMENAIYELMNADRKEFEDNADESIRRTVKWSLAGIPQLNEELQDVIQKVKQINSVDGVGVEMVSQ
ncbi:hypothetical protein Plec18167_003461 [Paecilomyces lecythidis]|uniref:Uncharacterized protein n=1 Tax=Paecilomyces lecythidis TaxID=3004212 RepID=A0ABR3XY31_9EURO